MQVLNRQRVHPPPSSLPSARLPTPLLPRWHETESKEPVAAFPKSHEVDPPLFQPKEPVAFFPKAHESELPFVPKQIKFDPSDSFPKPVESNNHPTFPMAHETDTFDTHNAYTASLDVPKPQNHDIDGFTSISVLSWNVLSSERTKYAYSLYHSKFAYIVNETDELILFREMVILLK